MAVKKKITPPRTEDPKEIKRWYLKVCEEINKIQKGSCTLTANGTTTTVTDVNITTSSIIVLFPTSDTAAVAVGSATGVYVSTKAAGSFILTHPNTADADKTFDYMVQN